MSKRNELKEFTSDLLQMNRFSELSHTPWTIEQAAAHLMDLGYKKEPKPPKVCTSGCDDEQGNPECPIHGWA